MVTEICPECGNEYKQLARHWAYEPDHRPEFTNNQREILTGLLMSDGHLRINDDGNPKFIVSMANKKYINCLSDKFGILGNGVSKTSGDDIAASMRKGGADVKDENISDQFRWSTKRNPSLEEWNWYTGADGKKVWPEDIDLTPTVLTHLYVGDGTFSNHSTHNNISIGAANEYGNEDKIDSYFERADLPLPSNYDKGTYRKSNKGNKWFNITFTVKDSYTLWDYMGSPPTGFEYKWPEEYR